MQGIKLQYTTFTNRIIINAHEMSRFSEEAANTLLGSLSSSSQEAFAMLLKKNGYKKWEWMLNDWICIV
jgi:hypothetical protein